MVFCTETSTSLSSLQKFEGAQGSKLGGAGTPLNDPTAPSNFCREPKYVLFDIHNIFKKLMKMQLGSLEKILISSPGATGEFKGGWGSLHLLILSPVKL